jgi:hypothetical protein
VLAFYLSVSTPQYFLLQSQKLKTRIVGTKVGLMTTFAAAADFFFLFLFWYNSNKKVEKQVY